MVARRSDKRMKLGLTCVAVICLLFPSVAAGDPLYHFAPDYFYDDATGLVWAENLDVANPHFYEWSLMYYISGWRTEYGWLSPPTNPPWLIDTSDANNDGFEDTLTWRIATEDEFLALLLKSDGTNMRFVDHGSVNGEDLEGYDSTKVTAWTGTYIDGIPQWAVMHWDSHHLMNEQEAIDSISTEYQRFYDPGFFERNALVVAEVEFGTAPPAVPEPATILLLGAGLLGAAGYRRKYKRKGN